MQIDFELTEDDLIRATRCITDLVQPVRRERWLVRLASLLPFVLIGLAVVTTAISDGLGGLLEEWILLAAFAASFAASPAIVIFHARYRKNLPERAVRRSLKKGYGRTTIGDWTFTVSPDGIEYSGPFGSIVYIWQDICRLEVVDEFVLFFVAPAHAIPVPRGAFANKTEFRSFSDLARRYRDGAPSFEPKCPDCGYDLTGAAAGGCPECGWRRKKDEIE